MIHAIGAGITLIEVQQNVDLTYRLYDYGRPLLAANGKSALEWWSWSGRRQIDLPAPGWIVPVIGGGQIDGQIDGQAFAAG